MASIIIANPRQKPVFYAGDYVTTVVGRHAGQVLAARCNESACSYDVRFDAMQLHTDTRLLGKDGPITFSPVAVVHGMRDFELVAR